MTFFFTRQHIAAIVVTILLCGPIVKCDDSEPTLNGDSEGGIDNPNINYYDNTTPPKATSDDETSGEDVKPNPTRDSSSALGLNDTESGEDIKHNATSDTISALGLNDPESGTTPAKATSNDETSGEDIKPNATSDTISALGLNDTESGEEIKPNATRDSISALGLNDTDTSSNTTNESAVPKIPQEFPIAGDNVTAPPVPTSTITTVSDLNSNEPLIGASIPDPDGDNANVTVGDVLQESTTVNETIEVTTAAQSGLTKWWNSLFASDTTEEPTTVSTVSTTLNTTSSADAKDIAADAPIFETDNSTEGMANFNETTTTDNSSIDNSTASDEFGLMGALEDYDGEENTTSSSETLTNSTISSENSTTPVENSTNSTNDTTTTVNSTLISGADEDNVNGTENSTVVSAIGADNSTALDNSTIITDNTTTQYDAGDTNSSSTQGVLSANDTSPFNETSEDNSTISATTPVDNSTLFDGNNTSFVNGTLQDTTTPIYNASLPDGNNTVFLNGTTEDNNTLTTPMSTDNSSFTIGALPNGTMTNTTDFDNTTLPSITTEDNSTLANETTTVNTTMFTGIVEENTTLPSGNETTTWLPDVTVLAPDIPEESPAIKENLPSACSDSLGLENGAGRLTASDWSPGFLPEEARLNGRSGWVGGFMSIHYIQAELSDVQGVSGLRLQPHAQWHRNVIQTFRLLYSLDGYHWTKYKYERNNKTYSVLKTALNEHTSESLHVFDPPFQARYVVINPLQWVGNPGPAVRFELYGCRSTISASAIIAPTVFRGEMQKETTWEPGRPYLVDQMVRIWPGVTFRLLPGVEVYFANPQAGFLVEGTLVAEGKPNSTVAFESGYVLSHLTVGPFWKGLRFVNGDKNPSILSHVKISGAAIGVEAIANSVSVKDIEIQRCETGFRMETGIQNTATVIENGVFAHNKYGIHIQNVTGPVKLSRVYMRDQQVIGITGYFVYESGSSANGTAFTLSQVTVENSSYAIYLSGYNNLEFEVSDTHIHDCHYGIFLDYSDAVPSISTTVRDSTFVKNRVYGLVVDYKHFARSTWYRGPHSFKTLVTNNVFDTGANGVSYYSPEIVSGVESEFMLTSNTFKNLHSGTIVHSYELSSFQIEKNSYTENGGRALEIFYNAIGVKGTVKNNTFEHNHAADNANDTDIQNDTLIALAGNSDAEMHGVLTFTENIIMNNSFPHIMESSLVSMDMRFNVFENKMADCELCVTSLWVHGGKTLNASHNWWGTPKLAEATQRVADFYRDMDVAAAEISPILREPRVAGASWDTVPHRIVAGGSLANGGIITGNVTASTDKVVDVTATIYVPSGNVLNIPAGSHLRFAKDIGIVVEGQLHIQGTKGKPVLLEQQEKALWKGIRLAYANDTSLSHVTIMQSRGIESSGTIPYMDSITLKESTGPAFWLTVIQPQHIELRGITCENGDKEGMLLEIQGDGLAEISVAINECHISGNKGSGMVIRVGNVVANISLENNVITDNSQDGVNIETSNGRIEMVGNTFKSSHPGGSIENNRLAHITFDGRCMPEAVRDLMIRHNSFSEENKNSTPGSLLLETPCINSSSHWNVSDNVFSIVGPTVPGDEAMLKLDMADNTEDKWPLQVEIANNSFTCKNQVGSSVRLSVAHGEEIVFRENRIVSCDAPLLVESRYLQHELVIEHNSFEMSGPVILQAVEMVGNESYPALAFSYNEISGSSGEHEAVLKTTGYLSDIHYNFFENPDARHDLWVGDMAPVNATLNWWGTPDFNRILSRVFDGRTDYARAQADIFPCLLSRNYSNISTANPDVFQITDNKIGGSVHGNITLPHRDGPYDVEYPIRIPPGSSLTIPGGTTLIFHNHTGIFADGQLTLDGNSSAWINMIPANDTTSWRGVTIGKPRQEFMRVRLSGSRLDYTGRVEAYVSGVWRGVCADGFNMAAAHVVCKELSFFDAESIKEMPTSQSSFGVSDIKCTGLEISLLDCNVRTGLEAKCKSGNTPIVVCQQENNVPVFTRSRRSTSVVSDNHPTVLKYTRILQADVGLQVNDDDGIELESMNVTSSTGPGIVLSSRGAMGVHLTNCTIVKGGDVGLDVAGSCSVTMKETTVEDNKLTGVTVKVTGENSDVILVDNVVRKNGEDGIHVVTGAEFNISGGSVALNKATGITLSAARASMSHTMVEDHVAGGVEMKLSDGRLSVKNSVFANNGGHTFEAAVSVNGNGTGGDDALVEFEKSGFINGSLPSGVNDTTEHSSAILLHLDTGGTSTNSTIPVRIVEIHVLDSFGDGIVVEDIHGDLNLTIAECIFDHIEGTAIHVTTNNSSPELYFSGNAFHHVKNSTLLVDIANS